MFALTDQCLASDSVQTAIDTVFLLQSLGFLKIVQCTILSEERVGFSLVVLLLSNDERRLEVAFVNIN